MMVPYSKPSNVNNGRKDCVWVDDPIKNDLWHSSDKQVEWVTIDLGQSTLVKRVVVYDRDQLSGQLKSYNIHVGNSFDHYLNPTCSGTHS
mmetsp:Transcript_48525/g.35715  ORF Transcript_48525/g.35715 Transcript_48525/m.35715 type:complete len:90 (-) Transcript_48525:127-396(-)